MFSIKIPYNVESSDDKQVISRMIREYNSMFRYAFNRIWNKESVEYKDVANLNNVGYMDSWYAISALKESKDFAKTVNEGNPKQEKVIFGCRKKFLERMQGKLSHEELVEERLRPLTCYGEQSSGTKTVHGNRKFKMDESLEYVTLKVSKDKSIKLVLPNIKTNLRNQLALVYKHHCLDDMPITYKLSKDFLYINIEETDLFEQIKTNQIANRVLAIDMNPNYIGCSVVDWNAEDDFEVIFTKTYSIKDINDKELRANISMKGKRDHELLEISKDIVKNAIHYRCSIVGIEDLNFKTKKNNKEDKSKTKEECRGRNWNRLCHNLWNREDLVNNLKKRCNIFRIKLVEVIPNYSSFVGNVLYRSLDMPDMVLASIEIGRRAYEFYNQYIAKIKEQRKNILFPNVQTTKLKSPYDKSLEEFGISDSGLDWMKVYSVLKKSEMMYRLSVDRYDQLFSRCFSINSSVRHLVSHRKNKLV